MRLLEQWSQGKQKRRQQARRSGAWFSLFERSALSRVLRLCQETRADHGAEFHHGAVLADLSLI
jgi:hypothetical protein